MLFKFKISVGGTVAKSLAARLVDFGFTSGYQI